MDVVRPRPRANELEDLQVVQLVPAVDLFYSAQEVRRKNMTKTTVSHGFRNNQK